MLSSFLPSFLPFFLSIFFYLFSRTFITRVLVNIFFSACISYIKAKLDINKEQLAAELVCLLDVASRPQDTAELQAEIESFFIAASVRIDLIAKVTDLDNDIGGYNFDIPLLDETQKAINDVENSKGVQITYK